MIKYWTLSCLLLILSFGILIYPNLPQYISYADNIDPQSISHNFDPDGQIAIFNNQPLPAIKPLPPSVDQILGDTTVSSKKIEVDLTNQRLYAYENGQLIYNFLISSGTWNRTPTGTFYIWIKVRSQKMSGGSKELGTYYYLPNVPYIMFFYNDQVKKQTGYSLHGTYWHNNFGVPMSHGCINMKTEEVAQVYGWAEVGTPITIYGKYQPKTVSKVAKPQT